MALALYRKHRPQRLGDLVGQDTNVELLRAAAQEDRLGQAYLFYGPRGTGKTTTARLIAKLANCETRATDEKFRHLGEPCNECRACREIDSGASLGLVEIDAASNRGIDEIRNLKEGVSSSPAGTTHKIYIIDEAHMLTTPAWNALLKTLEEPPRHAIFILATTEYEKVPATITSRTQRFLFKKVAKTKIAEKLGRIAKIEKIAIEQPALDLVAAAGDGSMRDAESILDQLASTGKKISLEDAERLTGRVGNRHIETLAGHIARGDLSSALEALAAAQDEGLNVVELTRDLIHYLRKVVTLAANPNLAAHFELDLTADELARLTALVPLLDPARGVRILKSLLRAYTEIRYSPFALIPLEMALTEELGRSDRK